ncbi:putative Prolyl 3-hydroxylase OGFOD1 [Hypsibius exemplaris]|uniref:Prolyl 3-hydroxylase OGFOD1 n=1 Tax=Hypsibius exemplaris TaxID=2072580 RepID=A0A1W0X0Y7_HYPEX|nr:putative Prolyl 3-hydroxylase OGFOD1 [Hypsibius exemplaris]
MAKLEEGSPISFDNISPTCSKNSIASARAEDENGLAKRMKTETATAVATGNPNALLSINPIYTTEALKTAVSVLLKAWKDGTTPSAAVVQPALGFVFRKPFPHLVFPDFFHGPIDSVEEELLRQKFTPLSTDLLQLSQTKELSRDGVFEFADVTDTFRNEVRPWVATITNTELKEELDIRGAKYTYTDHLVCHDDRLTTRKIAYVYYLTDPSWSEEDGGTLDLFESSCVNDVVVPGAIEKSILPTRNSMVLFVVGDDSFHQVREVLSTRKARLSLTGWFHATTPSVPRTEFQPHAPFLHLELFEAGKDDMVNCFLARDEADAYSMARKKALKKDMTRYHGCTVRNLLKDSFYQSLTDELRAKEATLPWSETTNRNQDGCLKYIDINTPKWPKDMPVFGQLLRIMQTECFLNSINEITSTRISVMPLDKLNKFAALIGSKNFSSLTNGAGSGASAGDTPDERWVAEAARCRLEKFESGDYSLKTYEAAQVDEVIDLFYYMDCDLLEPDCGGAVVVMDINDPNDEWDPIISMDGESNGLMVVRRDRDHVFFTEYVNHRWARRNGGRPFYRLWISYSTEAGPINSQAAKNASRLSPSEDEDEDEDEDDEDEVSDDSDLVEPGDHDAALSSSDGEEDQ